jgi:hypothetical protein
MPEFWNIFCESEYVSYNEDGGLMMYTDVKCSRKQIEMQTRLSVSDREEKFLKVVKLRLG